MQMYFPQSVKIAPFFPRKGYGAFPKLIRRPYEPRTRTTIDNIIPIYQCSHLSKYLGVHVPPTKNIWGYCTQCILGGTAT